ncbi:putative Serine/threonine-protein kinase [Podospora aff. communis PSN243]|uniref:Serine/threonine-protein kinase n=1 Tax=Podospora aff. communis PSN243 TaxID=3040156 RepID=A0AAV9G4S3_9PEZI|nr:putative Serine/threonine-protein kinase [Podospora aff. communis PSN243]
MNPASESILPVVQQSMDGKIGRESPDQPSIEGIITCHSDKGSMDSLMDQDEEEGPDCHEHDDSAIGLSDDGRSGRDSSDSPSTKDQIQDLRNNSPQFKFELLARPSSGHRRDVAEPEREKEITEADDELVSLTQESRTRSLALPPSIRLPGLYPSDRNYAASAAFTRDQSTLPAGSDIPQGVVAVDPSEITDLGHRLYSEDSGLERRSTEPKSPTKTADGPKTFQDQLFESLEPRSDKTKPKGFFSMRLLNELLTEESVGDELSVHLSNTHEPEAIDELARQICSSQKNEPSYRKIFAILVLIEKTAAITKFIAESINDCDLPLVPAPTGRYSLRRSRALNQELKCFRTAWTPFQIRNFEEWQWTTLTPFFAQSKDRKKVEHYVLHHRVILPFLPDTQEEEIRAKKELLGGGGRVFKTIVHPENHNFHKSLKCPLGSRSHCLDDPPGCTCLFAVKCLHSQNKASFKKEVDMLKRFGSDPDQAHPHLISLLATYEQNNTFFLIFPRAEADLLEYWGLRPPPTPMDAETVIWMAGQCRGIAQGVLKIHTHKSTNAKLLPSSALPADTVFGNHGDIKPENVLWFQDPQDRGGSGRGVLKLSDFGLADLSHHQTVSRNAPSHPGMTLNYRPPECDLPSTGTRKNLKGRQYDMWTLGCLYLEFVTWLIGGRKMVDDFAYIRATADTDFLNIETDTFFQIEKHPDTRRPYAIIKPQVTQFISRLHHDSRCTDFVHDFLELIQTKLLLVKQNNPYKRDRIDALQLHVCLTKMTQECQRNEDYCCKPTPGSRSRDAVWMPL